MTVKIVGEGGLMYGIGVDLGTSFSAAATAHAGTLEMVRLGGQAVVSPSAAYLEKDGRLLTGEAADRLGRQDSSRVAREFKRRLGDPTPMLLAGAPYSPTALMAALLSSVMESVTQARGGPPDHIVLTHPAVWGPYRQEQFAAIPPLAGLPRPDSPEPAQPGRPTIETVTEPVAAATYYCSTHPLPSDGLLAVYDLGGGTFDSAVVRNGASGLEIVGIPEGIEWLGGADFDQAILDHVNRQLGGAITRLDPADPGTTALLAAVQRECVLAKEALSTRLQADVSVPLPDGVRHVTITRDTFEKTITPSLDATVEAFRRTLTNAGITPQDLTAVLLVGGSSQIPLVGEVLRDTLRLPILINTHPKHAVALGAAMLSADALATRRDPAASAPAPAQAATAAERPAVVVAALPPSGSGADASPAASGSDEPTVPSPAPAASGSDEPTVPSPAPAALSAEAASVGADGRGQSGPTPRGPGRPRIRARSRYVLLPAIVVILAMVVAGSYLALPRLWGTTNVALPGPAGSVGASPTTPAPNPPSAPFASGPVESRTPEAPASPSTTPRDRKAPPSTGVLRSVTTGLCTDSDDVPAVAVNGVAAGGHAYVSACHDGASQQWREGGPLSKDPVPGPGWYRLLDELTGFCLDSNDDGYVYTLPCANPNDHQTWQRVAYPRPASGSTPSGAVVAYRNLATNRCLSVSGSDKKLQALPCPSADSWPTHMMFRR